MKMTQRAQAAALRKSPRKRRRAMMRRVGRRARRASRSELGAHHAYARNLNAALTFQCSALDGTFNAEHFRT